MLRLEDVSVSFGEKTVLKDFCFEAAEGGRTCILGQSGGGKTTLWRLAAGLMKPDSGTVRPFEHRKAAYVFQEDRLLPWCSCLENLTAVGAEKARALEMLWRLGLEGEEKSYPDELSGGMKRRLAIARALSCGGELIFMDEPLQGLDIRTAGEVLALLAREIAGKTALVITHSPAEALALGDRIVVTAGPPLRVLCDRAASELSGEEELRALLERGGRAEGNDLEDVR